MAILNNSNAISSGGYDINNSLRFRSSASAYLSRTPASAGNRQKWTWSAWVKLGKPSDYYALFGSTNNCFIGYGQSTGGANLGIADGNTSTMNVQTTALFRDPSAWYHIVFALDTTQATASDRVKIYVNGTQQTSFVTATYPAQNAQFNINNTTAQNIGRTWDGFQYFDGYMTEMNHIDGQQLTPSSFGETDTTTGSWKPKAYTGTYGTNGFYLKFADASAATAAAIGKDSSGNSNNWTPSGISVTAGVTYDAMIDSPTLTSATVANYCVMNPLAADSNATFSNANLTIASNAAGEGFIPATIDFDIASSTGYYFEVTVDSNPLYSTTGFIPVSKFPGKMWTGGTYPGQSTYNPGFEIRFSDGTILQNGGSSAYGSGATAGDTWGFAIKNGKVWARNSSGWFNSGNPVTEANPAVTGQTGQWLLGYAERAGAFGAGCTYNFGQRPFAYTPPTGFVALNTYNLPDSTIKKGNTVMDATAYTGTNGSPTTQVISSNFQPDFLWFKKRSAAYDHALIDTNRGITKQLYSNLTNAEGTDSNVLTAIGASSFTVGNSNYSNYGTLVAWTWKANGGTTSSNTSGSITSTVQANTTAGFSIVTYTGTGANATVGHGLGVAPSMIIVKNRSNGAAGDGAWQVYHTSIGAANYLVLNTTAASAAGSTRWQSTTPDASKFYIGNTGSVNNTSENYVAYCWAEIAGFSKFGSYTGNGSADGTFVYTGFRPKYVLIKASSAVYQWLVWDSVRTTYNIKGKYFLPDTSNAEDTFDAIDFVSNGFKIRVNHPAVNTSATTYIYMAFAENPFKNANAA